MNLYLDSLVWTAVDIETTGIDPYQYEIVEIGAVRFSLKQLQDKFQVIIKTTKKHDPRARKIHNISDEEINQKGVSTKQALEGFLKFIADDPLVFHNAPFDVSFLSLQMKQHEMELPQNQYYDNLYISRTHFPERDSHSLENICIKLGVKIERSHRALFDAEATARVFSLSLLEEYGQINSRKKYNSFMRYHRRFNKFKLLLPKNIGAIENYFNQYIQTGNLVHLKYKTKEKKDCEVKGLVKEVMIFNQRIFIKIEDWNKREENLVPLKDAVIYDKERGHINIDQINYEE